MTAQEPVIFEPTMQKSVGDCGAACLRMLTGCSYSGVIEAFPPRVRKKVMDTGMSNRQLRLAARKLGFKLRYVPLNKAHVGILDLQRLADPADPDGEWEGHYAMLAGHTVFNPADGLIWTDIDAFLKTRRWEVVGVFVRTKGEDN